MSQRCREVVGKAPQRSYLFLGSGLLVVLGNKDGFLSAPQQQG